MLISQTITDALIELGVLNPIDEASPQDHSFGIRTLNRIIDLYNTEDIIITYLQDKTYAEPETGWQSSTTIGYGLEFDEEAPVSIQGAFFRQDGTDYTMKPMTNSEWSSLGFKEIEGIPNRFYEQKMEDNSVKIYFDIIPQQGLELHLQAKMPYTGTNGVGDEYIATDDINWTRGFEKMLMLRLAVELAPSYEVEASMLTISKAQEAEDKVKTSNFQPRVLKTSVYSRQTNRQDRQNRARY